MSTARGASPSRPVVVLLVVVALSLVACGAPDRVDAASAGPDEVHVTVSTAVLGDLVGAIVGDRGTVTVLMEPGQDPHTFQLSAQQVAEMQDTDLLVVNGLGLEAALSDAIDQAEADGVPVLRVGERLDPLPAEPDEPAHDDEAEHDDEAAHDDETEHDDEAHHVDDGHDHGPLDPHVWLDVARMARAPAVVAEALEEVAPGPWEDRATDLAADLDALDAQVAATIDTVPQDCRRVASDHGVLGYFASRYGLEVAVTVIPGTSTDADPSARDFAAGVATVRDAGVPVVVVDVHAASRVADAFADEADVDVLRVPLTAPASDGPGADGYEGMMRAVADGLADALSSCD